MGALYKLYTSQGLYRYTIHKRRREIGLSPQESFLKKAHDLATQWRSVLHERSDSIKEMEKITAQIAYKIYEIIHFHYQNNKCSLVKLFILN